MNFAQRMLSNMIVDQYNLLMKTDLSMKELLELLESVEMRFQMIKQREQLLAIWKDVIGKDPRRRRFGKREPSNFLKSFEHMIWQLQNENEIDLSEVSIIEEDEEIAYDAPATNV